MNKTTYLCTECGDTTSKWMGKCPSCGGWNTLKEFREAKTQAGKKTSGIDLTLAEEHQATDINQPKISTHIDEVDRVLGGGLQPGSLILFGGSPGVGKSTLSMQLFLKLETNTYYFSGEESVSQVTQRASRLAEGKKVPDTIFATHSLEDILTTLEKHRPAVAIVDSVQMVGLEGTSFGSTSQIRENAELLAKVAKSIGTTILLIGHVTKADEIAGPRVLEHIVDVVLQLEGDKSSGLRILRSPKNRFGSTMEIGVFEMDDTGLHPLANPSEFFLAERAENASGSCITVVREGMRNFLLEIQALTASTNFGLPRRTSHGVDISKLHLLLAVISKFTPHSCESFDAYVNVIGGWRIREPAADLAILAALLSSRTGKEIPADTIVLGEVGLSGEVRSVSNLANRLTEAHKRGFKKAIIPVIRSKKEKLPNIEIQEVKSVSELLKILF